jgi:hypothetical protein
MYAHLMASTEPAGGPLETLNAAREQAELAVAGAADAHEAFRIATKLAEGFREVAEQVSDLRGVAAARIRDQEALSLRGLASRIGVSPARAEQLVNRGKQKAGKHD